MAGRGENYRATHTLEVSEEHELELAGMKRTKTAENGFCDCAAGGVHTTNFMGVIFS